jgi:hypothetical protein
MYDAEVSGKRPSPKNLDDNEANNGNALYGYPQPDGC